MESAHDVSPKDEGFMKAWRNGGRQNMDVKNLKELKDTSLNVIISMLNSPKTKSPKEKNLKTIIRQK
jgi:hypothetical protein